MRVAMRNVRRAATKVPESSNFNGMDETRLSLLARAVVGGLLVLESIVVLAVAVFTAMIGGLTGALAFIAGGGGATNEKLAQGFAMMAITIASPFVVAAVLGLGGVLVLLRRKRRVIITAGIVAIAAQIAFHLVVAVGFHAADLVPCAMHLLVVAVGFAFVPDPNPSALT